jgi:hypothetical protein
MIVVSMINANQLVNGIWMGTVLIALGLFPAILQGIADAVLGMANTLPLRGPMRLNSRVEIQQPGWFAPLGAALTVASILAYSVR